MVTGGSDRLFARREMSSAHRQTGVSTPGSLADVLDELAHMGRVGSRRRRRQRPSRERPRPRLHRALAPDAQVAGHPRRAAIHLEPGEGLPGAGVPSGAGRVYVGGAEDGLLSTFALAGGFSSTDLQKRDSPPWSWVVPSAMPMSSSPWTCRYGRRTSRRWTRKGTIRWRRPAHGAGSATSRSHRRLDLRRRVPAFSSSRRGRPTSVFGRAAELSGTEGEIERRAAGRRGRFRYRGQDGTPVGGRAVSELADAAADDLRCRRPRQK